jgi:hypothetical protein
MSAFDSPREAGVCTEDVVRAKSPISVDETFLIEEYKSLREEIKTKLGENVAVERQTLIAIAAVMAAAATLDEQKVIGNVKGITWIIWWIPFIIAVFARAFDAVNTALIGTIGLYIKNTQEKILLFHIRADFQPNSDEIGWEHSFANTNYEPRIKKLFGLRRWFWRFILATTLVIALWQTPYQHIWQFFSVLIGSHNVLGSSGAV